MKRSTNGVLGVLFMIIYLMLGVFLIINPEPSSKIVCGVIGGVLGVVGIVRVINYFKMDRYEAMLKKELAMGMLFLLMAFYVIMKADVITSIIPIALGIVLVYEAMGLLQLAVDLARAGIRYWLINLISGVIILILGIIGLFNPFKAFHILMIFLGISFVVAGIASVISMFLIRIFKKEYDKGKKEIVEVNQ